MPQVTKSLLILRMGDPVVTWVTPLLRPHKFNDPGANDPTHVMTHKATTGDPTH